jgi:hypothetical protein
MPRRVPTALEKLATLETKRQAVLEERKKELIRIFEGCNAFAIDDSLLAGFLLFATNPNNKDHPMLEEFRGAVKGKRKARARQKPSLFRKVKSKQPSS